MNIIRLYNLLTHLNRMEFQFEAHVYANYGMQITYLVITKN